MDAVKPFDMNGLNTNNILYATNVVEDLDAVVDSLGSFQSAVAKNGKDGSFGVNNTKFLIQRYSTGLTKKAKSVANSGPDYLFPFSDDAE